VGSSTVKVYELNNGVLSLIFQKSILFKNDFNPQSGFSAQSKEELFNLLNTVKLENQNASIDIYATAIFRNLLPPIQKIFIDEVFKNTGLHFNIISQELENYYLGKALLDKCQLDTPILIINIGGGSTELIIAHNNQTIEKYNIDFGVGTIINQFPKINDSLSAVDISSVIDYVKELLPSIKTNPKIVFYTGGELNYMTRAKYPLKINNLFQDSEHPFIIDLKDFQTKNRDIYNKITFKELESLMPENPKWMNGARTCSAIAQAICDKYNIVTIIPSDSNMINGVARELSIF
jgi:hypothetical protein